MELRIGGLNEAQELIHTWPTITVSIGAHGTEAPTSYNTRNRIERIEFRDTLDAEDSHSFTAAHAEQLLIIGQRLKNDDRVLIHCSAGVNRAPSASAALLIGAGNSAGHVWETIIDVRPQAGGNALMIARIDIAANAQRALWNSWAAWAFRQGYWHRKPKPNRPLTDEAMLAQVQEAVDPSRRPRRY